MASCRRFLFVLLLASLSCGSETIGLASPRIERPPLWKQLDSHGLVGVAIDHFKDVLSSTKETAVPGMLGRLCSVLMLHPLDTMKTRAQVLSLESRRLTEVWASSWMHACSNDAFPVRERYEYM